MEARFWSSPTAGNIGNAGSEVPSRSQLLFEGSADAMFGQIDLGAIDAECMADLSGGPYFDNVEMVNGVMGGVHLLFYMSESFTEPELLAWGILNPAPAAARGFGMTDTYQHVSDLPSKIVPAKKFILEATAKRLEQGDLPPETAHLITTARRENLVFLRAGGPTGWRRSMRASLF